MKKIAALLFSVLLIATAGSACSGSAGHRGTVKTTVSAESFGAGGTDTSDDTKALQDALFYARDNATSDVPVTVTLGDGTYYLRQAVTIYSHTRLTLSDNAVLVFTGQEGLMLFGGADRNSYDAVTDVMISGGVWRGNASRTGAHTEPIGFHSASGITLTGLTMEDSSDHFVMLTGVRGALVKDCSFRDHFPIRQDSQSLKEALHIDFLPLKGGTPLPSEDIAVEDCRFDNVASGIGTHHYGSGRRENNILVRGCRFVNLQYNCINAYSMTNLTVSDCTAENCPAFLWCNSTDCRINSNKIHGCGDKCMSVNENSVAVIKGNELKRIGTGGDQATAIAVGDSACVIEDNDISEIDGRAIRIKGRRSLSVIRNNSISLAATQGIFLLETMAAIGGNEIKDCQGVWAESSEACVFDNRMERCQYGIMSHGGSVRVFSNIVASSRKTGVHITYSENSGGSAVIENNVITDSGEDDVRIGKKCVGCVVRDNNPSHPFRIAASKQSDTLLLRNGLSHPPTMPSVSCQVSGNSARLSWQRAEGAAEYVIYRYDSDNDRLSELAVTEELSYTVNGLPDDSSTRFFVLSRSADGAESFYTTLSDAVTAGTGQAVESANVLYSQAVIRATPGEEAVFKVLTAGSGLRFQWECRKKDSLVWNVWHGRESACFTAAAEPSWNGMQVRCAVTDSDGNTVYSAPAEVVLTGVPELVMQSGDVSAYSQEPASLHIVLRGDYRQIRWYYMKPGNDTWMLWRGRESPDVSFVAGKGWNGTRFRCEITGEDGRSIFSQPVAFSVRKALRIISQPPDRSLRADEDVTFEVKAVGEGALRYQWYYRKAGDEEWTVWKWHETSATSATANDSWQGMQLKCVITDGAGATVETRIVSISIYDN